MPETDKVVANVVQKPDFLANIPAYDMSDMNKFSQPPRLKCIQQLTGAPYKPPHRDGDVIVVPQMVKVGDLETPLPFTPIYFFPMYICVNPHQMKAQLPFMREVSYEDNSEVAAKARKFITEPCPENRDYKIKYQQMLNFLCIIHSPDISEIPVLLSFKGGEYKTGQILIGLYQDRGGAPPYACRFSAVGANHVGKQGNWFGLNISNDHEPWVTEEQFKKYVNLHDKLKEIVQSRQMIVDLDDTDVEGGPASEETRF